MALSAGNVHCSLTIHRCALSCSHCSFALTIPLAGYFSHLAIWDNWCQWFDREFMEKCIVHHVNDDVRYENTCRSALYFSRDIKMILSILSICFINFLHDSVTEKYHMCACQLIFSHSVLFLSTQKNSTTQLDGSYAEPSFPSSRFSR